MNLEGKIALVTGASRGIGKAIALELARLGADVVVNYAGSEQKAKETADEITAMGRRSFIVQCDISDSEAVGAMVKETIDQFGRLDILVNNAGITRDNLMMRMKEQEWDDVINTNLKGVFLCTKAVTRQMMKQKSGRIINISSVVGRIGNAGQANYTAAKAGVIGLTKASARELAPRGITVNALAPGFITTDMTDELPAEAREQLISQIPLGTLGDTADIAAAAAFLASDGAKYITGQVLGVDGGMAM
ncbi:3-oxoacyl-[acyl-carrier-protein] reductase [Domibacillus sp. DTU_2020_1001157_1_SI_ALB_TIR_016]|uniref:3-oxoacyl-[acyl-carrier-protein] reductase n=1 Tax=Domibacillus sp. DTU_2020_1001157_1_SI_ALB_TIR_016 TaxID=3077789 RepID=UPI0028E68F4A|nr:3-oxoacyl-[acyl-carrier-protein] reductase [Domibacillus sp. DTU_2020_1001157_1_SI_ALB_TIR_016]WNS79756.1 3-oxoacyl-[acyl-carrier-protein] reductase [Domibacillus sp. DTU_2020_1001157_1_SI_ALB_TIR_016]